MLKGNIIVSFYGVGIAFFMSCAHAGTINCQTPIFRVFKGAHNGAAYITLTQTASLDDCLTHVECDKDDADHVEIHDHMEDPQTHIMRMVEIKSLLLPAKKNEHTTPVTLKPGGKHLMLMGVKDTIFTKDRLSLTLCFEHSRCMVVTFDKDTSIN
jgi:copper(I)-binding protein